MLLRGVSNPYKRKPYVQPTAPFGLHSRPIVIICILSAGTPLTLFQLHHYYVIEGLEGVASLSGGSNSGFSDERNTLVLVPTKAFSSL